MIFRRLIEQLASTFETRHRVGELCADLRDLNERCRGETGEQRVHGQLTDGKTAGQHRLPAGDDQRRADAPHCERGQCADSGPTGDGAGHQTKDGVRAAREHEFFATLGHIRLHHADATDRFAESAGQLRERHTACAIHRSQACEGGAHPRADDRQKNEHDGGHAPIEPEQHRERCHGGDEIAGQLYQSRAEQIADTFGIREDA